MIPATVIISFFLLGIEELGIQVRVLSSFPLFCTLHVYLTLYTRLIGFCGFPA